MNFEIGIFVVDGQRINSYQELLHLADLDKYKNCEYIEVVALLPIAGG